MGHVISLIKPAVATLTRLVCRHSSISNLTLRDTPQLALLAPYRLISRPWLYRRPATPWMGRRVDGRKLHHLASQRRVPFQDLVDRRPLFDHVGHQVNGNSRPAKHRSARHNLWVRLDRTGGLFQVLKLAAHFPSCPSHVDDQRIGVLKLLLLWLAQHPAKHFSSHAQRQPL